MTLGILDAETDAAGRLWFAPAQRGGRWPGLSACALGSGLNYAAIGLVADLLDRIAELKLSARRNS